MKRSIQLTERSTPHLPPFESGQPVADRLSPTREIGNCCFTLSAPPVPAVMTVISRATCNQIRSSNGSREALDRSRSGPMPPVGEDHSRIRIDRRVSVQERRP